MPGQKSIGGNDTGKAGEAFSSNRLALGGQTTALVLIEARSLGQLLFKDLEGRGSPPEDIRLRVAGGDSSNQQHKRAENVRASFGEFPFSVILYRANLRKHSIASKR